jgi:hypothetical protein
LYETLVTEGLKARLDDLDHRFSPQHRAPRAAEAADRIAWHLSHEIERSLAVVAEEDRVRIGLVVARALLDRLGELVAVDLGAVPVVPASVLHAILRRRPEEARQ